MRIVAGLVGLGLGLGMSSAQAGDWRSEDTDRQVLYSTIVLVDYLQTRQIIRECEAGTGRRELNPLLPECPKVRHLNSAIGATLIGHITISWYLPPDNRRTWQRGTIGIHGAVVLRNFHIGLYGHY